MHWIGDNLKVLIFSRCVPWVSFKYVYPLLTISIYSGYGDGLPPCHVSQQRSFCLSKVRDSSSLLLPCSFISVLPWSTNSIIKRLIQYIVSTGLLTRWVGAALALLQLTTSISLQYTSDCNPSCGEKKISTLCFLFSSYSVYRLLPSLVHSFQWCVNSHNLLPWISYIHSFEAVHGTCPEPTRTHYLHCKPLAFC